jgi:hypothetical protein
MIPEPNDSFASRVNEMREWLEINGEPDATDEDAIEALEQDCGLTPEGYCTMAGSEYCDWDCPFSS